MTISPPKNCEITFREPFFRKEFSGHNSVKYYIRASIDNNPEQEIRITYSQQKKIIDYILHTDLKLTNAVVKCDSYNRFTVLVHSPQEDFFDLVKEEKCTS